MFFVPEMISRHPPAVLQFRLEGNFTAIQQEVDQFSHGRNLSLVMRREGGASGSVEELAHFFKNGRKLDIVGKLENQPSSLAASITPPKVPEILREATAIPDLQLSREDFQVERRKRVEEGLGARRRSPLKPALEVMDVKMTRPKLISKPRPATAQADSVSRPRLLTKPPQADSTSSCWSVGDKVLAFWCGDNSWQRGVIHELDATSALVVFSQENLRPAFTDFSLIKPDSLPLDLLSHLEQEVTNISRDLQLELPTRDEGRISASMTESQVLDCSVEDFSTFARTGAGSRLLQSYVAPHNRKLCQVMVENILSCNVGPLKMMTNARACFLLQKIFDNIFVLEENQRTQLTELVLSNFSSLSLDQFGYHVVLAAIRKGGRDCSDFTKILENKSLLFRLVKDPKGTFVAQACVEQPNLAGSTVTFLVNTLLGHLVELSNHNHASFFIQTFLRHWAQSASLDFTVEDILRHLRSIIHHPQGVHTVQTLLKARPDYQTVSTVTDWIIRNMEAVYNDNTAVFAAKQLVSTISANFSAKYSSDCCWRLLLDKLVYSLMVGTNSRGRNHFISASCSAPGNRLILKLLAVCPHLNTSVKSKLHQLITSYRTSLAADNMGCSVLRAAKHLV